MIHARSFSRMLGFHPSLAAAVALGVLGGAAPAMAKSADQPKLSDKFRAAAGPLQKTLADDKGKTLDAAAIGTLNTQLSALTAAATTPDDKYFSGQFAVQVGTAAKDTATQGKGIHMMLDSGKTPADQVGKFHFYLGNFAYGAGDNATAMAELKTALSDGYTSPDAVTMLAESQFASNQTEAGLATLQQAIAVQKAAGQPVPDNWFKRGLGIAYKAKLPMQTATFGGGLAAAYPSPVNWAAAVDTLRTVAKYTPSEEVDIMRLMGRTNSYAETNDYLIYLDDADAHRLPGEAKQIIDAGLAAGKLKPGIESVADAQTVIRTKLDADRASLPHAEAEAHGAAATANYIIGTADAFLGYGEPAKAAELYQLALSKPGANADLVNTRLGIAMSDSGDQAGAQAAFAKVGGVRAPIAKLWSAYAASKAPVAAAAPAKS